MSRAPSAKSPFDSMMGMLGEIYDTEDFDNTIKIFNNFKESECHFAFLHASPLIIFKHTIHGDELQPLLWSIDYQEELRHLKDTLKKVDCDINFISSQASVNTFPSIMSKNPMMIHFSGHGVRNNIFNSFRSKTTLICWSNLTGTMKRSMTSYYLKINWAGQRLYLATF